MVQKLWQTPESSGYLTFITPLDINSIVLWLILQTMYVGTFSRLFFCVRSWGFKIYPGRNNVLFGSHFIFSNSVAQSWTKSEMISVNEGLRLDRMPALDLWELIVRTDRCSLWKKDNRTMRFVMSSSDICSSPHTIHKRKQFRRVTMM